MSPICSRVGSVDNFPYANAIVRDCIYSMMVFSVPTMDKDPIEMVEAESTVRVIQGSLDIIRSLVTNGVVSVTHLSLSIPLRPHCFK